MAYATALGDDHRLPRAIHGGGPARRGRIPARGDLRRDLPRRSPPARRPARPLGHGADSDLLLPSIRHLRSSALRPLRSEVSAVPVGPPRGPLHRYPPTSHHQEPPGRESAHVEPSKQAICSHTTSIHAHHVVSVCGHTDAAMTPGRTIARPRSSDRRSTGAPHGRRGPDRRAPPFETRPVFRSRERRRLGPSRHEPCGPEPRSGDERARGGSATPGLESFACRPTLRLHEPHDACSAETRGWLPWRLTRGCTRALALPGGRTTPLTAASRDRAVVLAGSFHKGRAVARRREH